MTIFKLYNESIDKRISMFDHNNVEYSLFILKYETNRAKYSVFLLKKAAVAIGVAKGGQGARPSPNRNATNDKNVTKSLLFL